MPLLTRHDSYASFVAVAIRRHVLILVVCTLLGFAAAFGYAKTQKVSYTATASVLPTQLIGNPIGPDTSATNATQLTVAIETEAGLVDSSGVEPFATQRAGTTVPAPGDKVVATVPPNTTIIKIDYTSPTRAGAALGAQAFAEGYLDYRQDVARTAQRNTLAAQHKEYIKARDDLRRATAAALAAPSPFAAQRQALAAAQVKTLKADMSTTRSISTDPGRVVTRAAVPTHPNGLSPVVLGVAGAMLGLLVGLGLAVWREARRDRVDSTIDDDVAGVPLLTRVGVEKGGPTRLLTTDVQDDEEHDAYRRLRSSLLATAAPPSVVAVASLSPHVSAAGVTANLSVMLARAGFKVTLIEAVPGGTDAVHMLEAEAGPGLTELLGGATQLGRCVQVLQGIHFVAPGEGLTASRELLAGPALGKLVAKLGRGSDYVLLAASALPSADAEAVMLAAQHAVLVVEDGVTRRAQTALAVERLDALGVTTVGAVVTSRVKKRRGHDGRASGPIEPPAADADQEDHLVDATGATEGPGIPTHA